MHTRIRSWHRPCSAPSEPLRLNRRFGSLALAAPLALLALAAPTPLHAADGRLEIDQVCATVTGCFPGDAAGFPVEITASAGASSFLLTSDLTVSTANTTAITITVYGVNVVLGGFRFSGPGTAGTGDGIDGRFRDEITIQNGSITDMGNDGLEIDARARVQDLHVADNGGDGIVTDLQSIVLRCTAHGNGGFGIDTNSAVVTGNRASFNGLDGIRAGNASVVVANSTTLNGEDGIQVRFDSLVLDNASRLNVVNQLNVPSGTSGYGGNAFQKASGGGSTTVSGSAVELGSNLCDFNTTCP